MRNSPTVYCPSFQNVLASAFALQQSHMDGGESLVDIVELERSVTEVITTWTNLCIRSARIHEIWSPHLTTLPVFRVQLPFPELDEDERNPGAFLSNLASTLSASKAEAASADAALDLSLNGIAQQACVATNASAAVIALKLGEEWFAGPAADKMLLSCTGYWTRLLNRSPAPTLGKSNLALTPNSDSRIDYLEAEHLGIRSFLIFPVLRADDLVGLLEVFSPRPRAFDDRANSRP